MIRDLILANGTTGHNLTVSIYILNQCGLLSELGAEETFLGSSGLATSFLNLAFREVAFFLLNSW